MELEKFGFKAKYDEDTGEINAYEKVNKEKEYLGLGITKEIIKAHHENINVISTEGVGTEFIFTLPKSKEEDI